MEFRYAKIETYVSQDGVDAVLAALAQAGAGHLEGSLYDSCSSATEVTGHWRPLEGAEPHIGSIGELSSEPEIKIEATIAVEDIEQTVAAVRAAHPYEEPVIYVIPLLVP